MRTIQLLENFREVNRLSAQEAPSLVVLVFDSYEVDSRQTVERIKNTWPQTHTVALIENEEEILGTKSADADAVLLKGTLAASLLGVIESLLAD